MTEALTVPTLHSTNVTFETDKDGHFDLRGLPESWSGKLWVPPDWKVVSTTHGQIDDRAAGVRFTEPATDVVLCVTPRSSLCGRLVLRDDGSPLGGAQLAAMLHSPDFPSSSFPSAKTDEEGRFEILNRFERIDLLELRLGHRFHGGTSILRLDEAELLEDGDLGDVVVESVRLVPFLLQDAEEEPIPGGVAVAAGVRSDPTGEDGRGELRWITRAADRLVAEARGFDPTEAEIPDVAVDPIVVTMERANELVVKLLLPGDPDFRQFRVILWGEERIIAGPPASPFDQLRHVSQWRLPYYPGNDQGTFLSAQPDEHAGVASFYALRPGIELTLEVLSTDGDTVYHSEPVPPLAPAEHREIEVSGMITFVGHVLDEEGRPLQKASINLEFQHLGYTNAEGAFECFLSKPQTGTLLVSHSTCTMLYLVDYTVPTDGQPVEFRLKPAPPLTIEVVDENSNPLPEAQVFIAYRDVLTGASLIEGNRYLVHSRPDGPFEIWVVLGGREFKQPHDPAISEAVVMLPVPGSVFAVLDATTTAGRTGSFKLEIWPLDPETGGAVATSGLALPRVRLELPVVLPGTYLARLTYYPSVEERSAGQRYVRSEPTTIEVVAGLETEVHLTLPADDG